MGNYVSHEAGKISMGDFNNTLQMIINIARKLASSLTAIEENISKFAKEYNTEFSTRDDNWETMILNGIRNDDK